MKALLELISKGGPVMIAIITLSVVLYSRCFALLLSLRRPAVGMPRSTQPSLGELIAWRERAERLRENFRSQRIALGSMIAAAPLLGLLGTVSGMVKTFESLSVQTGQKSMGGLASGISEVLVATESGLTVAIPALLLVYIAHRQMHKRVQELNTMEIGEATS